MVPRNRSWNRSKAGNFWLSSPASATSATSRQDSGVYSLQIIDGPGVLKTQPAGGGSFDVKVLGTTNASTLMITQVRPRFHVANGLLSIDNLIIRSGQIGSILASPAELDGAMSPLSSSVGTLEFGALGPGRRSMSTVAWAR